jgi:hypothetical protein
VIKLGGLGKGKESPGSRLLSSEFTEKENNGRKAILGGLRYQYLFLTA